MTKDDIHLYGIITKVDEEQRIVEGYASTEAIDSDGEVVSREAVKKALPDYMRFGNIREMHQAKAAGKAIFANIDKKGLYLKAKIVADDAWKMVKEKVYQGFSIGGRKIAQVGNTIIDLALSEISLVDRPANPEAIFTIVKFAKSDDETPTVAEVEAKLDDEYREMEVSDLVDLINEAGDQAVAEIKNLNFKEEKMAREKKAKEKAAEEEKPEAAVETTPEAETEAKTPVAEEPREEEKPAEEEAAAPEAPAGEPIIDEAKQAAEKTDDLAKINEKIETLTKSLNETKEEAPKIDSALQKIDGVTEALNKVVDLVANVQKEVEAIKKVALPIKVKSPQVVLKGENGEVDEVSQLKARYADLQKRANELTLTEREEGLSIITKLKQYGAL